MLHVAGRDMVSVTFESLLDMTYKSLDLGHGWAMGPVLRSSYTYTGGEQTEKCGKGLHIRAWMLEEKLLKVKQKENSGAFDLTSLFTTFSRIHQ